MPRFWPITFALTAATLLAPAIHGNNCCLAADPATSPSAPDAVIHFPLGQPSIQLPLTRGGAYLFVQAKVNHQPPGWFMVDTGTSISAVDRAYAQNIHLKPLTKVILQATGGLAQTELYRPDYFSLGDVPIDLPMLASADLTTLKMLVGVDFQGILGNDVLLTTPITLDFRAPSLTLYRADSHPIEKGSGVPARVYGENDPALLLLPGNVENIDGWFDLDTGDPAPFTIFHPFATLYAREFQDKPSFQLPRTGIGGTAMALSTRLDRVQLFGRVIQKTWSTLLPANENPTNDELAGVLGTEYFDDARITVEPGDNVRVNVQWLQKESAQTMLARLGDPKGHDLANVTPLMWACREGRTDVAAALIAAGADVNAADADGRTALMTAASNGCADAAQLLISHAANLDAHTIFGDNALIFAAEYGFADVVKQLIAAKPNLNARNTLLKSPIFMASQAGFADVVKLLIDAGADMDVQDNNRDTPLMAAAFGKHPDVEQLLLDHGASVSAHSATRETALAIAAAAGDTNGVALLLQHGAPVDFADGDGDTPLFKAAAYGRSAKLIRLLLAAGADPNITNNAGVTPLASAQTGGWEDAVITLLPVTTPPPPNP